MQKVSTRQDDFESQFFQLAFDQLQDKAAKYMKNMVGFHLVNKSDDGNSAIANFQFRFGNDDISVPVFFKNGSVKNLSMCHSKNNDQFYPLSEDFLDFFYKSELTQLGDHSQESLQDVKNFNQSNLESIVTPPRTGKITVASLLDYVKEQDNDTKAAFYSFMEKNAAYCEEVLKHYSLEEVADAVCPVKEASFEKVAELQIFTKDNLKEAELTNEEKTEVLVKGYLIKDARDASKKSKAILTEYTSTVSNPDGSGAYLYVTKEGLLRLGLVLTQPRQLQQHMPVHDTLVIDLGNDTLGNTYVTENKKVFVKNKFDLEFKDLKDSLIEPSSISPSYDDQYILIDQDMNCSIPFRINVNYKDAKDIRRLEVSPYTAYNYDDIDGRAYCCGKADNADSIRQKPRAQTYHSYFKQKEHTLVFTKNDISDFQIEGSTVYVPKSFKLLKLNIVNPASDGVCCSSVGETESQDEREKSRRNAPGSYLALVKGLNSEGWERFHVNQTKADYKVSLKGLKKQYKSKTAAYLGLVKDFGFDADEANTILDTVKVGHAIKGFAKLADDYYHTLQDEVPYTNSLGQPTYQGNPYMAVAPGQQGNGEQPARAGFATFDPQQDMQKAIQLSQRGHKDLFDTKSIETLARYTSPQVKIDELHPKLLSALDGLGRILFLFNWDVQKFEDMFGKEDLPEFSELLNNVFKNLGELIVFLKHRSPELSINNNNIEQQ